VLIAPNAKPFPEPVPQKEPLKKKRVKVPSKRFESDG
jgi:hypothetical protein